VTLPDGRVLTSGLGPRDGSTAPFTSWTTTPTDVARTISQGLADNAAVARITWGERFEYSAAEDGAEGDDGMGDALEEAGVNAAGDEKKNNDDRVNRPELWDMGRPLVGNVEKMEFLKFEDREARTVFWHSSAHILGEALEHKYGGYLTIGPPLSAGFYYDSFMGDAAVTEADFKGIEKEVATITKKKQKFERLVVTKSEALELFAYNPFKSAIISTKVPDGTRTTVYRCGDLIDLCRGPHLPHTGRVKAFGLTSNSATQWLGKAGNDQLQRVYGISFPDKKMLKVWQENQAKAKERDHRIIGQKQNLFMFHELSPGSCFFLPHGTRIYNTLINFIKSIYRRVGYQEIITPNVFNLDLWHKSGHAQHYKDAMFCFDVEGQEWGMKPMNCPGHCLLYASSLHSYRDLPLRYADFGVLHRNELSGALTGLTRVRRFQQDDAHIYCREDQIEDEVLGALHFMKEVYDTFGMTYKLELSTRPEKALGEKEVWDRAESALAAAMNKFAGEGNWRENPGDGAFYGPKVDIKVMDAMERVHQCATVQLDFQLPIRFDLKYKTSETGGSADSFKRPVMVHRAILGSVERMFAVLAEHYGGKWPFWMSPRQVMIVPVHADQFEYGEGLRKRLHDAGIYAELDATKATFQKKVRNAQVEQYNFQVIIGKEEMANGTVNVRTRANRQMGEMDAGEFVRMCVEMVETRTIREVKEEEEAKEKAEEMEKAKKEKGGGDGKGKGKKEKEKEKEKGGGDGKGKKEKGKKEKEKTAEGEKN